MVIAEMISVRSAIADAYPITEAEKAVVIWGHDPSNKWLVGYFTFGKSNGRARVWGVWCCRNGSPTTGQMPGNIIPLGFVEEGGARLREILDQPR